MTDQLPMVILSTARVQLANINKLKPTIDNGFVMSIIE